MQRCSRGLLRPATAPLFFFASFVPATDCAGLQQAAMIKRVAATQGTTLSVASPLAAIWLRMAGPMMMQPCDALLVGLLP